MGGSDESGEVVHVRLVGAISLAAGQRVVTEQDLPGRQLRAAFAYLVLEAGRPVTHDEVAEALWPEGPPATWHSALRGIVSKVRGFLDGVGIDSASALVGEAGRYQLSLPPGAVIDVEEAKANAERAAAALLAGQDNQARALASAARATLSQQLLPGVDAPWLDRRRDELDRARAQALGVLGTCRLHAGETTDARIAFEEMIRLDPFDEAAWRGAMQADAAAGRAAKALATYEELRQLVAEELGADPSPETQALQERLLRGEPVAVARPAASVATSHLAPDGTPPYHGLRAFQEGDAARFFGRDAEVRDLVTRLGQHHFVVVVGPSGSGKSSVVRAGVLPALARGALPDSDTWWRTTLVPGTDPLRALSAAVGEVWPAVDVASLAARTRDDPAAFDEAISDFLRDQPSTRRLVILVDQFEELFTLTRDAEERTAFVEALLHAARHPLGRVMIVITMRADFVDRASQLSQLATALTRSSFVLGPLDPDGLQQAIERPLEGSGVAFESGVVAQMLADVFSQPGALPLLQHALLELWRRRGADGVLTREHYEEIGGVGGALARRAEATWSAMDDGQRSLARRLLLRLTELGEDGDDTRRRATIAELADVPGAVDVEHVVGLMVEARLLMTATDASGTAVVEVAHEALIRGWPRLAGWIDTDRAWLRLHRRLGEAAREWEASGRDPDLLWRGSPLDAAVAQAADRQDDLGTVERNFLRAAQDQAQRLEVRRRRRQRRLTVVSAAAALVLGASSVVAFGARRDAEAQRTLARSRALAAESANVVGTNPELATLLALEAWDVSQTAEAEAALRQAHDRNRLRWRQDGGYDLARISPDGESVTATGYGPEGGIVGAFSARDGQPLASAVLPGTRGADDVVFASDGRMAVVEQNGNVVIFDDRLDELARLPNAFAVSWSPGDRFLIGVTFSAGIWVADGTTYEVIHEVPESALLSTLGSPASGGPRAGSFTPDGLVVLFTSFLAQELKMTVLDLASGEVVREFPMTVAADLGVFSPDGRRLLRETETSFEVLDVGTWEVVATLPLSTGLADLAWIDEHRVATVTDVGTVEVVDLDDGTAVPLTGLTGARSVRSVDGRVVGIGTTGAIVWDPDSGARLQEIVGNAFAASQLYGVDVAPETIVVAYESGVVAYDLAGERVGGSVLAPDMLGRGPFHRELDTGEVVTSTMGVPGPIQVLDVDTFEVTHETASMASEELAVSDAGTLVASAAGDDFSAMALYDHDLREVARWSVFGEDECPPEESCHLAGFAFAPNDRVAVGTRQGIIRVYEPDGTLVGAFEPSEVHAGSRMRLAFTADGARVVRGALHPTEALSLVDLRDGSSTTLGGHEGRSIELVVRSVETGQVAVGDINGRVTVRDAETLEVVHVLEHDGAVLSVDFVDDDRLLSVAGERATLWDLGSSRPIATFGGNPAELRGARWLGDDRVATFDVGGDVRLHACRVCGPIEDVVVAARASLTRGFTAAERDHYLGG